VRDLGIDRRRFEVLTAEGLDATHRRWASHMDLVISGPNDDPSAFAGFELVHEEVALGQPLDATVRVLVPRAAVRPVYVAVPLAPAQLRVSENPEAAAAMIDGDLETIWKTEGPQVPDESWIEVHLAQRAVIGRIALGLGRHWRREPKNLHVLVRAGEGAAD